MTQALGWFFAVSTASEEGFWSLIGWLPALVLAVPCVLFCVAALVVALRAQETFLALASAAALAWLVIGQLPIGPLV